MRTVVVMPAVMPAMVVIIANFSHISSITFSLGGAETLLSSNSAEIARVRWLTPPARSPKAMPESWLWWRMLPSGCRLAPT